MQKVILPAVLAAAAAFLPCHAQAGGFSITISPGGYYPGYRYAPRYYAVPVYAGYSQGSYAHTPSTTYAPPYSYAPPGDPVPVGYGDQITGVTDRLAAELRNLREDVDVELPDARGRALAVQADDLLEQIEHLQKSVRSGASAEHLQEHAADLAKSLHEFLEATEALGRDGRFLNRSAQRIHDLDHYLLRLLGPAGNP